MDILLYCLGLLVFTFLSCSIGFAVSLLAFLPPFWQLGRRSVFGRRLLTTSLSLIAIGSALTTMGDFFVLEVFAGHSWLSLENNVLRFELWLRMIEPGIFRGTCISGNSTVCELADQQKIDWLSTGWAVVFMWVIPVLGSFFTARWSAKVFLFRTAPTEVLPPSLFGDERGSEE